MGAESWQKEQFSNAFMLAVATKGGYTLCDWNVDKDGVDATLRSRGLMVDIQLKSTQRPRTVQGGYAFDLDAKTYDKLKDPERSAPAYLVLVVVPTKIDAWILHQPENILMSCHGYWASFDNRTVRPSQKSVAIRLPQDQRVDVAALQAMFKVARHRVLFGIRGGEAA
jgi:uncharacterized protein DUF4365